MDKIYVIGIRHNPQLGSYLSKVIVASAKVNKCSITAKFEEYGSPTSLKFSKDGWNGQHHCLTDQHCVYGGYEYIGFSTKERALAELQKWLNASGTSAYKAKIGIELVNAN